MWNPSLFFISNRFYKIQKKFGPLTDHIITEFSWVVTMAPACDLKHHSGHRQDDWNCGVFAISDNTKLILGLCNINEWWRWHRSHTLACFWHSFVCHVTYLPISPQGRPRFELCYRVYLQQPVEFKIVRTENYYVPNSPVELAQWLPIGYKRHVLPEQVLITLHDALRHKSYTMI